MADRPHIIAVIGPTASGKTAKAVQLAHERKGEVISVDSRQVYRTLDIGTEKVSEEEMEGIPHHLIDIREPEESYGAGDFMNDAKECIADIASRGRIPILAGGTHFYFDALLYGLPGEDNNPALRAELEQQSASQLFVQIQVKDPRRAERIDPQNKRRLIRALEIIEAHGRVPERVREDPAYEVEWHILEVPKEELKKRIASRLGHTLSRGLVEEVRRTRERVGDARLNELGLEYRIVGEYLRGERSEESLVPKLSSSLWRYARQQKAWLRRFKENI